MNTNTLKNLMILLLFSFIFNIIFHYFKYHNVVFNKDFFIDTVMTFFIAGFILLIKKFLNKRN